MAGGRPLKYKTVEELENAIEAFFENEKDCPTITGLALHLGFHSRKSLYNYEGRKEFLHTIKKARTAVEMAYEKKLHGKTPAGAIFALKNFGWRDNQDITSGGEKIHPPVINFTKSSD